MDEVVPTHYVAPKITFTGIKDPESHFTAFNAQMIISGWSNAVWCKMLMGNFMGTTIHWFSGLLDNQSLILHSSPNCFENSYTPTLLNPPSCMTSSMCVKGKGKP